jgi:hypothetical protein
LRAKIARKRRLVVIPKASDLELSRECGSWRKVACCNVSKQFMLMASEGETPVLVAWHRGTGDNMADLSRFTRIWAVPYLTACYHHHRRLPPLLPLLVVASLPALLLVGGFDGGKRSGCLGSLACIAVQCSDVHCVALRGLS